MQNLLFYRISFPLLFLSLDPNTTLRSQKSHQIKPPSVKSQQSIHSQKMQNSIYTIHTNFQNPSQLQKKSNSVKTPKTQSPQQNFFAEQRPSFSFINKEKTSPKNSTASSNNNSKTSIRSGFLNLLSGSSKNKDQTKVKITEDSGFVVHQAAPQIPQREGLKSKVERTGTIYKNQNFNNRGSINSLYGPGPPGFINQTIQNEHPPVIRDHRDSLREHHERLVHIQSTFRKNDRFASMKSSRTARTDASTVVGGEA